MRPGRTAGPKRSRGIMNPADTHQERQPQFVHDGVTVTSPGSARGARMIKARCRRRPYSVISPPTPGRSPETLRDLLCATTSLNRITIGSDTLHQRFRILIATGRAALPEVTRANRRAVRVKASGTGEFPWSWPRPSFATAGRDQGSSFIRAPPTRVRWMSAIPWPSPTDQDRAAASDPSRGRILAAVGPCRRT